MAYNGVFPFLVAKAYWVNSLSLDKMALTFPFCIGPTSASAQMLPSSMRPCLEGRVEGQSKLSLVLAEPAVVPGDGQGRMFPAVGKEEELSGVPGQGCG